MVETIEALCAETHNYFIEQMKHDDFTIENGNISLPFLVEGQFFAIVGSKFNDGIYIFHHSFIVRDATWDDIMKINPDWGSLRHEIWGQQTSKLSMGGESWIDVEQKNPDWETMLEKTWGDITQHELVDETFHGGIWAMRMPKAFLKLAKEVKDYMDSDAAKPTGYTSESISGHYSYTKASPEELAWQKVFSSKLNRWRKVAARWG